MVLITLVMLMRMAIKTTFSVKSRPILTLAIYLYGFNHLGNDDENGSKDDIFREEQTIVGLEMGLPKHVTHHSS
jgi:hypothetical protein